MRLQSWVWVLGVGVAALGVAEAAPVRKIVPKGAVSFLSKSQRFAVWLPVKPVQDQVIARLKGGRRATVFTFEAKSGPVQYVVIAASTVGVSDSSKKQLADGEKGFLRSSGATVQKREEIQLGKVRGRELKVTSFVGRPARTRIYIAPKFYYQILAQSEKALTKNQSAQIDKVLDSFRILPQ